MSATICGVLNEHGEVTLRSAVVAVVAFCPLPLSTPSDVDPSVLKLKFAQNFSSFAETTD